MTTSEAEMASRPMQLPKIGWDDTDTNDSGVGSSIENASCNDDVEQPYVSVNKSSSEEGTKQRAVSPRNTVEDLAPIPEDYSMHGGWPDYYSDLFCYPYGLDYDDHRRKGYRYRFCRRLCEDRRYRLLGLLLLIGIVTLYVITLRHQNKQTSVAMEAPLQKQEESERYEMAAMKWHQRSFGRDDGWDGTNYLSAMDFCLEKNANIPCPYEAYCPLGEGKMPLGGNKDEPEGSWAPFFQEGSINEWVSLSSDNSCEKYSTKHDGKPSWGLTGNDAEGFTRHVSCCLNVKGKAGSTSYNEDAPENIARPPLLEEDLAS